MVSKKTEKPEKILTSFKRRVFLLLVLILILVGGFLALSLISKKETQPSIEKRFKDCKLLADSCINENCRYYFLCSGYPNLENCKVYDCGEEYGIEVIKKENKIETYTQKKPDVSQAQSVVRKCQGEIKIYERKCQKNSIELKLEVKTEGNCPINAFLLKVGEKGYIQPSWERKKNLFYLKADNACGAEEVIAIGIGGVAIRKRLK